MDLYLLELSRAQLQTAWNKSRFNQYSDARKKEFHKCLGKLYDQLIRVDYETIDPSLYPNYRNYMGFFIECINALDKNTMTTIPHEFIECLNIAAREWYDDYNQYIIVMDDGAYSITLGNYQNLDLFYEEVKKLFNIEFKYKLLFVSMPKYLSRDYLTNVTLYHELGHFIDHTHKLRLSIYFQLGCLYRNGDSVLRQELTSFFPTADKFLYINQNLYVDGSLYSYIGEYFADLFAAQYVGNNVMNYLCYLCGDQPNLSGDTHPSYIQRYRMVSDFVASRGNSVLTVFQQVLDSILKKELVIRYRTLDPSDFYQLIPMQIERESDIHSVFVLGWELFKEGSQPFKAANNMDRSLHSTSLYTIINNLIEKTISNYLIERDWNNIKSLPTCI